MNYAAQYEKNTTLVADNFLSSDWCIWMTSLQMLANRSTRLQRILEDTKEADGEAQIRERMQLLSTQLSDCISNLHETFTSQIFVATCRAFWDKMGQVN